MTRRLEYETSLSTVHAAGYGNCHVHCCLLQPGPNPYIRANRITQGDTRTRYADMGAPHTDEQRV